MNTLPEVIQNKIYLDKHSLEFHTTLEKLKHIKNHIDFSKFINEFNYSTELCSDGEKSKRSPPSEFSLREMIEKIQMNHLLVLRQHLLNTGIRLRRQIRWF